MRLAAPLWCDLGCCSQTVVIIKAAAKPRLYSAASVTPRTVTCNRDHAGQLADRVASMPITRSNRDPPIVPFPSPTPPRTHLPSLSANSPGYWLRHGPGGPTRTPQTSIKKHLSNSTEMSLLDDDDMIRMILSDNDTELVENKMRTELVNICAQERELAIDVVKIQLQKLKRAVREDSHKLVKRIESIAEELCSIIEKNKVENHDVSHQVKAISLNFDGMDAILQEIGDIEDVANSISNRKRISVVKL